MKPEAIKHKKLNPITKDNVYKGFNRQDLLIYTDLEKLKNYLKSLNWNNQNLLLMSSGNFGSLEFKDLL